MTWTLEALKATAWAAKFIADSPVSYEKAIKYALQDDLEVELIHNDDAQAWQWCLVVEDGFWMDALDTRQEAIDLAETMGWKITFEHDLLTGLKADHPIVNEQYQFRDEDVVEFDNSIIYGVGIIRGVAGASQPVLGANYIVEVLECSEDFPNASYPFSCIALPEVHISMAPGSGKTSTLQNRLKNHRANDSAQSLSPGEAE